MEQKTKDVAFKVFGAIGIFVMFVILSLAIKKVYYDREPFNAQVAQQDTVEVVQENEYEGYKKVPFESYKEEVSIVNGKIISTTHHNDAGDFYYTEDKILIVYDYKDSPVRTYDVLANKIAQDGTPVTIATDVKGDTVMLTIEVVKIRRRDLNIEEMREILFLFLDYPAKSGRNLLVYESYLLEKR